MKIVGILSLLFCSVSGHAWVGYKPWQGYAPWYNGHSGLYQAVSSHHGNTAFAYNDGLSTRKEHINADGTVSGSYSVIDANGNVRTVNYKAGANGFEVDGDTGVDKATADAAAKLADAQAELQKQADALAEEAPKAPEAPDAELPVAPTNPPDYGLRNKIVAAHRNGYYGRDLGLYGYIKGVEEAKPVVPLVGYNAPWVYKAPAAVPLGLAPYGGLYQAVSSHYGNTAFSYNDGLSARKEHINADGTVSGSYSVIDANGNVRTVNYKAGAKGFEVDGDTGVDKATADAAAKLADAQAELQKQADELAEEAPKAPEAPEAELPVAPTNPPDYGLRNKKVAEYRNAVYGRGKDFPGLYYPRRIPDDYWWW